jgi:peptidase A4-like protein
MRRMTLALAVGWLAIPMALASTTNGVAAAGNGVFHPGSALAKEALLQSFNWSGYADTGLTYTQVKGTWKVPTVKTQSGNKYASDWVGIGGFSDGTLIQAGTSEQSVGGVITYNAWTEIIPAPEVPIPGFTVHPGDSITVTVKKVAGVNQWSITVKDTTESETFTKGFTYASSEGSAEWIHEAPTVNGSQSVLALTNNVTFTADTLNGATKLASGGTVNEIQMITAADKPEATPSAVSTKGDAFAVADGAKAPKAPTS